MTRIIFNISKPEPVIERKPEEPISYKKLREHAQNCSNCKYSDFSYSEDKFKCAESGRTYLKVDLSPCIFYKGISDSVVLENNSCRNCIKADFNYSEYEFKCSNTQMTFSKYNITACSDYIRTSDPVAEEELNGVRPDRTILDEMPLETHEEIQEPLETCGNCKNSGVHFKLIDLLGRKIPYVECMIHKNMFGFFKSFKEDHSCGHFEAYPPRWHEIMGTWHNKYNGDDL